MTGVKAFVERLSEKIGDESGASVSIGIAETGPEVFDTLDELMQRADKLMYATKANQRAGVQTVYEQEPDAPDAAKDIAAKRAESA